ncbi:MAG: site-specific integrase [Lachnospiraceae bacterium]|nr:site-specific integrase [Lachnospiraceae bacterium]
MKKRKDGRYQRKFTVNGVHCVVLGRSKAELDRKEYEKRQQIESGQLTRANPTMDEFFNKWIEAQELHLKTSTVYGYRSKYRLCKNIKVGATSFGQLRLREVTTDDIRELQTGIAKRVKTATVNNRMLLIRSMFNTAVNENRILYNPCKAVKDLKRKEPESRETIHRALTDDEVNAFMEKAKDYFYYDEYRLALATGMRVGEIGALTTRDIHDGFIWINRTVTKAETGGQTIGDSPKTHHGERRIPLTENIKQIIEHKKSINSMLYGSIISLDGRIFRSPTGRIIDDSRVNAEIQKICKETGIEIFTMHAFRDTFATRCIEAGVNPKTLQELLGHANFNITMTLYGHVQDDTKIAAMETLQAYTGSL